MPRTRLLFPSFILFLLTACQPAEQNDASSTEVLVNTASIGASGTAATETPEQLARRLQATFPAQQRPPQDPSRVAQGLDIYTVNCRGCHGQDLRGGDLGGPNLLRSDVVLADIEGEVIGEVVKEGRNNPGMTVMPALPLEDEEVKAVAAYIHSIVATARGQGAPPAGSEVTLNIVVGDASVGEKHFDSLCSSCHSSTGDLAGIASRVPDPAFLQDSWVAGRAAGRQSSTENPRRIVTVSVQLENGETYNGRLGRRDDFFVSLTTESGEYRSFSVNKGTPAVSSIEINDPMARHLELMGELTDEVMHDITAYMVTLK